MHNQYRIFVAVTFCLTANAVGCNGHLSPQCQTLLNAGNESYRQGDYRTTQQNMDDFLAQVGKSRRASDGYYLRGLARLQLKDLRGARADMEKAAKRTRDNLISAKAFNSLGDMDWNVGRIGEAEKNYRKALTFAELGKKPSDHSHYRLGCLLQRKGKWPDADLQFSRLDYYFSGGELARRAARRINCRLWTVQAGAYKDRPRADEVQKNFRDANIDAMVEPIITGEEIFFVVQVERYETYAQAVKSLETVRQHVPDAFIITAR